MLTLQVKCVGHNQTIEGHHTSTLVVEKNQEIDALRQEVRIMHPELSFNLGEVYSVTIELKKP